MKNSLIDIKDLGLLDMPNMSKALKSLYRTALTLVSAAICLYPNDLKNWFLTASAEPQIFSPRLAPCLLALPHAWDKKFETPPYQIPNFSSHLGISFVKSETPSEPSIAKTMLHKSAIIDAIDNMSQINHTINPLTSEEFDTIMNEDRNSSYSQIVLDDQSNLKGFILASPGQERLFNKEPGLNIVVIDKLGVLPNVRQCGIAKKLLHSVAQKAVDQKVDEVRVLVYKENKIASDVYFKYGFDYACFEKDEPYEAFLLRVKPQTLFEKTVY